MRRVLVVTWALGTASGVLLGLFGVQLVSSRFSTTRVSPMSHPEVLRALQAARSVPVAAQIEVAAPAPPDTAPSPTASTDDALARPSAEAPSDPAPTSPASTLPRPGAAAAGPLLEAAAAPSSSSTTTTVTTAPPPAETSTTTTTKPKETTTSDVKKTDKSTTTTTARKPTTTTTSKSSTSSRTKTLRSRGGVVTVTWSNGTVKGVARPESGYTARFISNGPDKVEVWFWTDGRASQIVARADGSTTVTDWKCSNRPQFHCAPV